MRLSLFVVLVASSALVSLGREGTAQSAAGSQTIYVSPSGSDGGANCRRFAPGTAPPSAGTVCGSTAKAIGLAAPGDVIQLLPGTYAHLTLSRQSGADTPRVIVRGDPGLPLQDRCWSGCKQGNVIVSDLNVCGHGLSVQNLDSSGDYDYVYVGANNCPGPKISANHDLDLVNVHFNAGTLRGHGLILRHSRLGPNEHLCDSPAAREDNLHIWPDASTTPWSVPYDINVDSNLIYGANIPSGGCGDAHADLIQTLGYRNLTLQNNVFWHCGASFIQDGALNGTGISGKVVIRNNFFSYCVQRGGGYTQIGTSGTDGLCTASYLIENNTWAVDSNVLLDCPNSPAGGNVWRNNYLHVGSSAPTTCRSGTWDHNAFARSGITCGTNARRCTPNWLYPGAAGPDPAHGPDLHLAASDSCLRAGGTASTTAADIDGDQRPTLGKVDLGADQHENARIVIGRSIGDVRIGAGRANVEALYGSPSGRSARTFGKGKPSLSVVTYSSWGGKLWAAYDGDTVVGVGTGSSYYSTPSGARVGSPGPAVPAAAQLRWLVCRSAYVTSAGGVVTVFAARNKERPVTAVTMIARRYTNGLACA